MQFWSISPQNGLKMCAFLRGIMCATGCNWSKLVWLHCLKSMQLQPLVRSGLVFGLFSVAWTRPADTTHIWTSYIFPWIQKTLIQPVTHLHLLKDLLRPLHLRKKNPLSLLIPSKLPHTLWTSQNHPSSPWPSLQWWVHSELGSGHYADDSRAPAPWEPVCLP